MSSKLAYLSKYTESGPFDKATKKGKKKKKSKNRKVGSSATTYTSTVVDLDADDVWMKEGDGEVRLYEEEEDAPLIVSGHQWKDEVGKFELAGGHDSDNSSGSGRSRRLSFRRQRHDLSDEEEPRPRRRRHYSSSDESIGQTRRRHDSTDSDNDDIRTRAKLDQQVRKRHDSSDDESDFESRPTKMSSGHSAGLQNASQFSKAESEIQQKKRRKLADMKDSGKHSETVYRDKHGRKVDMMVKFEEIQKEKREQQLKEEAERLETQRGFAQKLEEEQMRKEEESIKNAPFARSRDNDQLETLLKDTIRAEDPMYAMEMKKREKHTTDSGKPIYKGPPPKPNRFGIRPGYRWDGNVRGNGFEDKILAMINGKNAMKEQAYKYSVADM